MKIYLNFLKPDGVIHLKTDSNFMFTYTRAMIAENQFPVEKLIEDIYSESDVNPILGIKTYYEKQWLERGITIKYLRFIPQQKAEFIEPEIEIEKDSYRSFKRERRG